MGIRTWAAAAAVAACAWVGSAQATIYTITYEGHLTSGSDLRGLTPIDLAGAAYSLVFTFDTEKGEHSPWAEFEDFSPISSALSINGVPSLSGSHGTHRVTRYQGRYALEDFTNVSEEAPFLTGYIWAKSALQDGEIFKSRVINTDAILDSYFRVRFSFFSDPRMASDFYGLVASPVPEPRTWAMMLIGFSGLALMRSRRREWAGERA